MALRFRLGWGLVVAGLSGLVAATVGLAQAGSQAAPTSQPPAASQGLTAPQVQDAAPPAAFTLQANSRIVLTDVTVTDNKGNPVRGLPESAFHIFDNNKPQQLNSFVEHRDKPTDVAESVPVAANVYSNAYLLHPPKVVNVILLDTTNLNIGDQMYLYYEMKQLVAKLPPGEPFAVYSQSGLYTIEQQTFTADHALLLAAIRRAIPRLPDPDRQYASDYDTLHQLVVHLAQVPGRKNVLWFSGGSNLGLMADADDLPPYVDMQPVYDELEASRIALYPIDARGLTVSSSTALIDQQMQMQQTAEATGGRATINSNGLAQAALKIADNDGSYYTLTYAPSDLKLDNKWHTVKVKVDLPGGYHLSYRHGYYDDGANTTTPGGARRRITANGEKDKVQSPDMQSQPIIFNVSVLPPQPTGAEDAAKSQPQSATDARKNKGMVAYTLRYLVPAAVFEQVPTAANDPGERQVKMGVAMLAFNQFGRPVKQKLQQVTFSLNEAKLAAAPNATLPVDLAVELPPGADYIYAAVWDMVTRRAGSIELPLEVPKPGKGKR